MTESRIAALVLVGTCSLWAFSFPLLKALERLGHVHAPGNSSLFYSALLVALRFSVAGAVFGAFIAIRHWTGASRPGSVRARPLISKLEWQQGLGIGFFGGFGLLLQMDGLAYTHGSVSAFLTQGYAVIIPLWVALTTRRPPGWRVVGACVLVCAGAAILAGVSSDRLYLGRGEWETLAGSVLFAGQILWLERPKYSGNDSTRATTIMFTIMAAVMWPLALLLAKTPMDIVRAYSSSDVWVLFGLLTLLCTLATFPLANHWQPKLPATQAGLLYCTEPVFTSLVCLFFPAWISNWTGISYPNETLTSNLAIGGGCILLANAWLQLGTGAKPLVDGPAIAEPKRHDSTIIS